MALGSNWMNNFEDDTFDQTPEVDVEIAQILRNDDDLSPMEVAMRVNFALRDRAEALGEMHAEAPVGELHDYEAGRDGVIRALDSLRNSDVAIEPTTADQLAILDHDRKLSRGLGTNVATTYPGSEPLENRDLVTVSVNSTGTHSEAHKKVTALLNSHTPFNTREIGALINSTLAQEAEELMVQEAADAEQLHDLNQRGVEDKPENVGAQRYDTGRRQLAAAVAEVRRTNKVALQDEVTDHLVTLDHDGLMSQQLGVEVAELYGRNPAHASQRKVPDFSKAVDPDFEPAPVLRQPASEFSREVREAQRAALAASQPTQTLRPAGETLRELRKGMKKPPTVVPGPIPPTEEKFSGPDKGPELG